MRYRIKGLYGSGSLKAYLERRLSEREEIVSVSASTLTGTLLVTFNGGLFRRDIAEIISDLLGNPDTANGGGGKLRDARAPPAEEKRGRFTNGPGAVLPLSAREGEAGAIINLPGSDPSARVRGGGPPGHDGEEAKGVPAPVHEPPSRTVAIRRKAEALVFGTPPSSAPAALVPHGIGRCPRDVERSKGIRTLREDRPGESQEVRSERSPGERRAVAG